MRDLSAPAPVKPFTLRLVAAAGALVAACVFSPLAGAQAFVNVAGTVPAVLSAANGAGDPAIEKLLTRPADLWERLRTGFALPDLDTKLVARHEAWYVARPELLRS